MEGKKRFGIDLIGSIQHTHFESGYVNIVDRIIKDELKKHDDAMKWLLDIFFENYNDAYLTSGILKTLAHFEYSEVGIEGACIASISLSHRNHEVIYDAIGCFENWEEPSIVGVLDNVRFETMNLIEYSIDVVSYLNEIKMPSD